MREKINSSSFRFGELTFHHGTFKKALAPAVRPPWPSQYSINTSTAAVLLNEGTTVHGFSRTREKTHCYLFVVVVVVTPAVESV